MVALTGKNIKDTFKDLLHVSNSNAGIDGTLRAISDGEGTASRLELSNAAVNVSGVATFQLAGTALTATAAEINVLDAAALTDGGLVIGKGTAALASTGVLGDGAIVIGDGATDPVTLSAFTSSTGTLKHEQGGIEADISAITTDQFLVGTGLGVISIRTPAQVHTSLGLVIGTDVQADLDVPSQAEAEAGTATTERVWTAERVKQAIAALESPSTSLASGTKALFQQTAAPTNWTKDTTHDDKALRVVTGTPGSGGATAFTSVFGSGKVTGAHTLATSEMPSHDHTPRTWTSGSDGGYNLQDSTNSSGVANADLTTTTTGGGGSHDHTLSLDLQFVDLIIATKD